ncbi:sensor domain-containing diguanylate cyclase [Pseudomonas sp. Irchel 3E20]|uniref:sensor domain-containing diguanylate cyclase n=1 Tax=Pseudomonas sp. Irchel 3E20 TaxID=2008983 RepID=UPI000BA427C5|nr:sensor domain-containing diguanylate cyclase [Pseudomonas sp. Irchel 3E20]
MPARPLSPLIPRSRSEWFLVLGSSLTVIAIVGIVTFLLIREHGSAEVAATRAAANIVQLIDADVLRNVELYDLSLKGLIAASLRTDLQQVSPQVRHLVQFDRATAAPYKGAIMLLDRQGKVVADSASVIPRSTTYAQRDFFSAHQDNPNLGMFISRPFKSALPPHDWRISFSRRISSEQGEFMGVAEAAMRLNYFNQLFRSLSIERDSSINLLSTSGLLLAQEPPNAGEEQIGIDFSARPNFVRILHEGNGSFSGISSIDGRERLYTFSQVGNLPLLVVVALSTDEVFAAWWRTAWVVTLATGVLCLGLLWLTLLLCHELRRRHSAEQELAHLAATDSLTGLANRRTLDQALEREWARAQRSGRELSLLMVDIDHFKRLNDQHGHQLGDEALARVAAVVKANIRRPGDLAARYGGEEFAVVLPETDAIGAQRLAENVRAEVAQLAPMAGEDTSITVSVGVATWHGQAEHSLDTLFYRADKALYRAKYSGRNRVEVAG